MCLFFMTQFQVSLAHLLATCLSPPWSCIRSLTRPAHPQPARRRKEAASLSRAPPAVRMTQISVRGAHSFTSALSRMLRQRSDLCSVQKQICMLPLRLNSAQLSASCARSVCLIRLSVRRDATVGEEERGDSDVGPLLVLPVSSLIVHRLHPLETPKYAHVSWVLAPGRCS
ncbi:hypothetical protein FQA47_013414 [Oryzias melastigma]|uniref:Uncharacterized protein n=1 Tax=Oryzias melastigma TaxID=30732 RepID=A0A834KXD2_ORYME|nr:hypothetical protein FQA47_013414 [Oryzias melastigma]